MRRLSGLWLMPAIALCVSEVGGQQRPDFTGRWTTGPERPSAGSRGAPAGTMGSGWASDIIIDQDADWLTVECLIFSGGDLQPPLKYRYALAGSRHVNEILMGYDVQKIPSTARWEGDRLVITSTYTFPDPETGERLESDVTRVLWLQGSSLVRSPSLVVEMTIEGVLGGPTSTSRSVYTRL